MYTRDKPTLFNVPLYKYYLPYLLEMTPRRLLISTAVEGGDNSSYAGSEAREVFINTSSDISGVNK